MQLQKTSVINWKHGQPPEGAIYIGRGTPWGNPFRLGIDGNRATVIEKYRHWLATHPEIDLEPLRGKVLICSCKPLECHGDVIVDLLHPKPELLS